MLRQKLWHQHVTRNIFLTLDFLASVSRPEFWYHSRSRWFGLVKDLSN